MEIFAAAGFGAGTLILIVLGNLIADEIERRIDKRRAAKKP